VTSKRKERQYSRFNLEDQRNEFEIDRDRLIYSFAFRRLAQVTQVASAHEGNVFHNRLTHSLKVAQVGRRLAEYLKATTDPDLIKMCGKLSANVVETACLAHDLGHPPFGHMAEQELDVLAREAGLSDGFEGNAQTFRILTKLEPHKTEYLGLNLTRATLNATLKYPWYRDINQLKNTKKSNKFSIYDLDKDAFEFVRLDEADRKSGQQSLEASIMEFADDITYSIHDLEDFYLAGLIPLDTLVRDEWEDFVEDWLNSMSDRSIKYLVSQPDEQSRLKDFLSSFLPPRYSSGTIEQITYVRRNSSLLIQRYIRSALIQENYGKYGYLERQQDKEVELKLLQRIVWKYVITNPSLATRQYGQRKIIRELFSIYQEAVEMKKTNLVPSRFLENNSLEKFLEKADPDRQKVRLAVDIVASLRESEAIIMYRRLTGLEQSSLIDAIA
jgi:dGTPase